MYLKDMQIFKVNEKTFNYDTYKIKEINEVQAIYVIKKNYLKGNNK